MTETGVILRPGQSGPEVTRLQEQLLRVGLLQSHVPGTFCKETERSVRSFQIMRGLRVDGIAGPQTWAGLSESGLTLGNRMLALRAPYMRGDDVLELQLRLDRLGFRVGRVDGIFGPDTGTAVREFQRNVAIAVDAICGPDTVASLRRFQHLAGGRISEISELERFHTRVSRGVRYFLVVPDMDFESLRSLDVSPHAITNVVTLSEELDTSKVVNEQADTADLLLAVIPSEDPAPAIYYFELGDARSAVGRALAEAMQHRDDSLSIGGRSSPLLRETHPPALILALPNVDQSAITNMVQLVGVSIGDAFTGTPLS